MLLITLLTVLSAQDVRFMEAVDRNTKPLPTFRIVDSAAYLPWLNNSTSSLALRLYRMAWDLVQLQGNAKKQPKTYYIGLAPDGNHAEVGFRLQNGVSFEDHPANAYVLLDPSRDAFQGTLLHETGHVVLTMLAGGRQLERADVVSIPHSTAALTDRGTAFSEGWAIHLETMNAQIAEDPALRRKYHRGAITFGTNRYQEDEYFRNAADLATYAQNVARYTEVRENSFAFQPAFKGPEYLRVQLERSRDFASLRNPNQLLQSEGFYASFFFLFLMQGDPPPAPAVLEGRYNKVMKAFQSMFAKSKFEPDTPWLPDFVHEYGRAFPGEKEAIIGAFNDISHGVFVDPQAASLWRQHYMAALNLDLLNLNRDAIKATRQRWKVEVLKVPSILYSRLGPQVPCMLKGITVRVVAFGGPEPLLFDINTAPEGVLRMVPQISEEAVRKWDAERESKPFTSLEDLQKRVAPFRPQCAAR